MKVNVKVKEVDLDGDYGRSVAGVWALCPRCGHETESFGVDEPSYKRCMALMRKQCPRGENNFYAEGTGG